MNETENKRNQSMIQLVRKLITDSASLVRTEANLIRDEVNDKFTLSQRGMKTMVAGGFLLFFSAQAVIATLVIVLAYATSLWLASLLVTVALAISGVFFVIKGRQTLAADNLKPKETIETLKENRDFAKEKWNERKYG